MSIGDSQVLTQQSDSDRRANPLLRRLIDEMLERLREMNRNVTTWTRDERARAESELDTVMARVRRAAGPASHS